ncbi:cysteine-rich repeat secretory protein 12-like [Dorcoceras hygrometricum]|uniref:Cysteine-rich repeat secretory protein 12-like n=1 Tax=Dorcoceras hygrometricum TaxID=472368 RepID=A0A2Z7BD98_9LAMI|nr:cysteine-rich repeat secretory protein 12-like [Dorcoceras hygrometricum]
MHAKLPSPLVIPICFVILLLSNSSNSSLESLTYMGCSQQRYTSGTPYESNVNSIFASLVNSATFTNFNNFKMSVPGSTQNDVVYGLFQCRGDLTNSDCHQCVSEAVSRLGSLCRSASGGALQYEGCFIKYDSSPFLGVEDKSVVYSKCGPSIAGYTDVLARKDAVLSYLTGAGQYFRVGGSGEVQGMTQCVQDLTTGECQDCLSEAIQRLKNECGGSAWGHMYLGKCYARFSESGYTSRSAQRLRRRGWWFAVFIFYLLFDFYVFINIS